MPEFGVRGAPRLRTWLDLPAGTTAPPRPAPNTRRLYNKNGVLYQEDNTGAEYQIGDLVNPNGNTGSLIYTAASSASDLLLNHAITASSSLSSVPGSAVDGNDTTYWRSGWFSD